MSVVVVLATPPRWFETTILMGLFTNPLPELRPGVLNVHLPPGPAVFAHHGWLVSIPGRADHTGFQVPKECPSTDTQKDGRRLVIESLDPGKSLPGHELRMSIKGLNCVDQAIY